MDHLVIPDGASHIQVPYKCITHYDGGDLRTYHERQGWTWEEVMGENNYGGRAASEKEAFFQTWLFFGLLVEAFKVCGIHINHGDFIDRERGVVTTQRLPSLFEIGRAHV